MCKVCEKVDSAIEMLESLFPVEELLEAFKTTAGDETTVAIEHNDTISSPESNLKSAKANFIALIVARYAVRNRFPPGPFEDILNITLEHEYFEEATNRIAEHLTGKRLDAETKQHKEKLKDYES